MSHARDALRKEKKLKAELELVATGLVTQEDVAYARKIKRDIKKGLLPKYFIAKDEKGKLLKPKKKYTMNVQTKEMFEVGCGLDLKLQSTYNFLVHKNLLGGG